MKRAEKKWAQEQVANEAEARAAGRTVRLRHLHPYSNFILLAGPSNPDGRIDFVRDGGHFVRGPDGEIMPVERLVTPAQAERLLKLTFVEQDEGAPRIWHERPRFEIVEE